MRLHCSYLTSAELPRVVSQSKLSLQTNGDTSILRKLETELQGAEIERALESVPLFSHSPTSSTDPLKETMYKSEISALAKSLEFVDLATGATIYKQNDPGEHFFLIVKVPPAPTLSNAPGPGSKRRPNRPPLPSHHRPHS